MRKVILDVAVSLDGYIEGLHGELDWLVHDEQVDFGDILFEILSEIDIIFYGRVSHDKWGNYMPGSHASGKLKNAYLLLHRKTKYVFSTTKKSTDKVTFINSNIKERVSEIKQEPGKHIWLYGGGKLITTFVNLGLIDIYRIAVHPVVLGSGIPLFRDIQEMAPLQFLNMKTSGSGVVILTYEKKSG